MLLLESKMCDDRLGRDSSVAEALARQVQGPDLNPQYKKKKKKVRMTDSIRS